MFLDESCMQMIPNEPIDYLRELVAFLAKYSIKGQMLCAFCLNTDRSETCMSFPFWTLLNRGAQTHQHCRLPNWVNLKRVSNNLRHPIPIIISWQTLNKWKAFQLEWIPPSYWRTNLFNNTKSMKIKEEILIQQLPQVNEWVIRSNQSCIHIYECYENKKSTCIVWIHLIELKQTWK